MKVVTTLLAGAALALALTTPSAHAAPKPSSPAMAERGVPDERLAAEFLRINQAGDGVALRRLLSPGFLLQRSDGTFLMRREYLQRPSVIEAFRLDDVAGTRTGDVRVVRYTLTATIEIDGTPIAQDPVPRLSTFVWERGAWRLVSHANFAAIPK